MLVAPPRYYFERLETTTRLVSGSTLCVYLHSDVSFRSNWVLSMCQGPLDPFGERVRRLFLVRVGD